MHFAILFTTFGLIFLAELPDKTAYTVLLLAARNKARPVLLGAWSAFLVQGLIAVALGELLSRLPSDAVRWTAAAVFFFFGLVLLLRDEKDEDEAPRSKRRAFAEAFVLVFLAEMGDATQIGTAALVARLGHPAWVFAGAVLALWSVSGLAVTIGSRVGSRVPKRLLRRIAGAVFIAVAAVSVLLAR